MQTKKIFQIVLFTTSNDEISSDSTFEGGEFFLILCESMVMDEIK